MYTILLVDDEEDVLDNLMKTIDWPVYGIASILTAKDGTAASQLLQSHHVDLLITDIRMPGMDGLSLIRHVHELYPHIRCILLSSHSDFQYAKEAISLGVENYLLKPVNADELDNSIRKSLDNLSMQKHVQRTLFVDNILYRWLTDDISSDELSERAKHIDINVYFRHYCVAIIKPLKRVAINQFLGDFYNSLKPRCDTYRFINYDGQHVSIIGSHTITQQDIANKLQQVANNYPKIEFHATIGNVVENFDEVHTSYQSALDCFYACTFASSQAICLASPKIAISLSSLQINSIVEYLKGFQEAETKVDLQNLFETTFSGLFDYSLEELNSFIDVLTVRLAMQLAVSGLIDSTEKDNITGIIYHFEVMPSKDELLGWFENTLSVCQALIRKHTQQLSPTIVLAMRYIENNYSEYASIKDFCHRYNINASYLGLLFKKETGIYFKDYINQIRISHAIRMVKSSNAKIVDICKAVGFSSTSHFILCFKKQTGLSPTRYKQLFIDEQT